jgi:hypothetical protein
MFIGNSVLFSTSFLIVLWIPGLCFGLTLDRSPHVRPLLLSGDMIIFPEALSFAHGHY